MGDPAGIGLELAARAWTQRTAHTPPFFFVGDAGALERAFVNLGLRAPKLNVVDDPAQLKAGDAEIAVLSTPLAMEETPGAPDPANTNTTIACIARGVDAVRAAHASALVTLPIAKAVLQRSGFSFPGHTEFIANLTKDDPWPAERGPVMMLAGDSLKVALATIHTPLNQVAQALTRARLVSVGRVVGQALKRDFGLAAPRIALCGLNPHAGEHGLIGREEIEIVDPAAEALRKEGWNVSNAQPADSMFHEQARARYDAAIALYHDQGLIPLKTLHFWDGINITLGLPIVRTSPDHGAGFDIAGQGKARPDSFIAALRLAQELAARRAAS